MEYIIISLTALFAAGLTLFSGFGLGTILMPVFAILFPLDIAISLTAIVHFLNNIFKLALLGKHAYKAIVLKFGIPAIIASYFGATLLFNISSFEPIYQYQYFGKYFNITFIKIIVAFLMIVFAILELSPLFAKLSFNKKILPLGGVISGFLGGLSGHQGALRSAFLLRCNLTKESFIATGVVIACMIDISRIFVYSTNYNLSLENNNLLLMLIAAVSAFAGSYFGTKLIKKVTIDIIQTIVAIMLIVIGLLLASGIL